MPDVASPSRYLPIADVAEQLSLDSPAVLSLIRSGALPAVDVALPGSTRRRWRVAAADLEAFLAARRSRPPARRGQAIIVVRELGQGNPSCVGRHAPPWRGYSDRLSVQKWQQQARDRVLMDSPKRLTLGTPGTTVSMPPCEASANDGQHALL